MYLLSLPGGHKPRRKSTSDLYQGMNVSKAFSILRISEREYHEMSDLEFREVFTRQQIEAETPNNEETIPITNSTTNKSVLKTQNPNKVMEESKKFLRKI